MGRPAAAAGLAKREAGQPDEHLEGMPEAGKAAGLAKREAGQPDEHLEAVHAAASDAASGQAQAEPSTGLEHHATKAAHSSQGAASPNEAVGCEAAKNEDTT